MIVDKIENMRLYEKMIPQINELLAVIEQVKDLEIGSYMYPWGKIMIQEGNTRHLAEGDFESHIEYIDIQYMLEGRELVEWANIKSLTESIPYNPSSDAQFWKGQGSVLEIPAGTFYVAFPEDGHKPCCHNMKQDHYRKMVVKIKIEKD